jgi:hypothetical protein
VAHHHRIPGQHIKLALMLRSLSLMMKLDLISRFWLTLESMQDHVAQQLCLEFGRLFQQSSDATI